MSRLSAKQLNAQRRKAVSMREQGLTLAYIRTQTGLSAPTIIAAHKAYLANGWTAVGDKAPGRPSGAVLTSTVQQQMQRALAKLPPPVFDQSTPLWSYELTSHWLAAHFDIKLSERSSAKYAATLGFEGNNHFTLSKRATPGSKIAQWLHNDYSKLQSAARKQGAVIYWMGRNAAENNTPELLYAHSTRGKFCWLALLPDQQQSNHLISFFARLIQWAERPVRLILSDTDIRHSTEINHWLQQQDQLQVSYLQSPTLQASHSKLNLKVNSSEALSRETRATTKNAIPARIKPKPLGFNQSTANPGTKSPAATLPSQRTQLPMSSPISLTHLQRLESESIHILREVVAQADNPVMLYSTGKDSTVMMRLAIKAFHPAPVPFPLLHIDTGWKFSAMTNFRDQITKDNNIELIVHSNADGLNKGVNPFTHGSALHTDIMKTQALRQALDKFQFDCILGGARRDEEISRAKERIFSFRDANHRWDPRQQRPELWKLYNTNISAGESIRVFPLSNWTELDVWTYIYKEQLDIVPLYFAAARPVVTRDDNLIMVDDDRMQLNPGEVPMTRSIRFRALGCYPLTGAMESTASTVPEVIEEILQGKLSERHGRTIDRDGSPSMEQKKQQGYF